MNASWIQPASLSLPSVFAEQCPLEPTLPARAKRREGWLPRRLLPHPTAVLVIVLITGVSVAVSAGADELAVVQEGKAAAAEFEGGEWEMVADGLAAEGTGRFLYATKTVGTGDFQIRGRLKLDPLEGTAASFVIAESHFGFDGRSGTLFVEGPLFGGTARTIGRASDFIRPDSWIAFEVRREGCRTGRGTPPDPAPASGSSVGRTKGGW